MQRRVNRTGKEEKEVKLEASTNFAEGMFWAGEDRWLWVTKGELVSLFSLRPDLPVWEVLKTFFLSDQNRPIPLKEILERTGTWGTLAACEAPFYAHADDSSSERLGAIRMYLGLVARAACVAVPIPYRPRNTGSTRWSVRWVRLSDILGAEAAEVIGRLWERVEKDTCQSIPPTDWYEELAAAISPGFVIGITRHPASGPTDIVRAIVEAITYVSPRSVSCLLVVLRALAWQYALRESGLAEMSHAHDLSSSESLSSDILWNVDQAYKELLSGLMAHGGEFLYQLPVR